MDIQKIIVVGGGTSGLTTALVLEQSLPSIEIEIIESSAVGTIGVGEGATEHWRAFCDVARLNLEDTLIECGATFKSGILFKNWGVPDYIHSTITGMEKTYGDYLGRYAYMIANNLSPMDCILRSTKDNLVSEDWANLQADCPVNQFHFNTFTTNDYLHKVARDRNIKIYDDKIKDVVIGSDGNIVSIASETTTYSADFFIDCTGFAKVLISKLGAKWESYQKHLKVNSAIAFPTEDTDEYPINTTATAMNAGWMWNTPVRGRWGNGYVFNDEFLSFEQAQKEVETVLGKEVQIAKKIKFDAGRVDRAWIKNCCSIGLSSSFVEPLESSAISQGLLQTFLLFNLLPSWQTNPAGAEKIYNQKFDAMCKNILDFIVLHYVTERQDTPFWKNLYETREDWMPSRLQENLIDWKYRLPQAFEFDPKYTLFCAENWILTLHGLQLFDTQAIKKEFEKMHIDIQKDSATFVNDVKNTENKISYLPHKQGLERFIKNRKKLYGNK